MCIRERLITDLVIPDTVERIKPCSFAGCNTLRSLTMPNTVNRIGYLAFSDCSELASITISKNVTSIELGTFWKCRSLTKVEIPNSVKRIEPLAFYGCSELGFVFIPDSVEIIMEQAFGGCSEYISIIVDSGNKIFCSVGNCLITKGKTLRWGCENSNIPTDGSVENIEQYAFSDCDDLTNIAIPNSVRSIESCAFSKIKACVGATKRNSVSRTITTIKTDTVVNINYLGTKDQWLAIKKANDVFCSYHMVIVHCSDGEIAIVVKNQ